MIFAPKDNTYLFQIRVKGQIYDVSKTILDKLQKVDSSKTIINSWLVDKNLKIDFNFETKTIWLGPITMEIPQKWWVNVVD